MIDTLNRLNDRAADLGELYWQIAESCSDLEAEHRNETAMFGDSWPGAQLQIAIPGNGSTGGGISKTGGAASPECNR